MSKSVKKVLHTCFLIACVYCTYRSIWSEWQPSSEGLRWMFTATISGLIALITSDTF